MGKMNNPALKFTILRIASAINQYKTTVLNNVYTQILFVWKPTHA